MLRSGKTVGAALVVCAVLMPVGVGAQSAQTLYTAEIARETELRRELALAPQLRAQPPGTATAALLRRVRATIANYEDIVRRYPRSGYSDNALWQAGVLAADAFWQFGDIRDRATALRLLGRLTTEFAGSSLVAQVAGQTSRLNDAQARAPLSTLKAIRREVLPDVVRITLELEREVLFYEERLEGPPRVFVDLQNTRAIDALKDATVPFGEPIVRQARLGRQADNRTRVVLDLQRAGRHSVYSLYNPYRVVIDFERQTPARPPAPTAAAAVTRSPDRTIAPAQVAPTKQEPVQGGSIKRDPPSVRAATSDTSSAPSSDRTIAATSERPTAPASNRTTAASNDKPAVPTSDRTTGAASETTVAPTVPSANARGGFSLSRQLGLGVARVVIDPGHGGHDPGAQVRGLTEAELVLDVALRLEKLLLSEPGVEVVLTRRDNTYVALEERPVIANRVAADLFLSIHANAAGNAMIGGFETYFLNFANNPEAEALAARENAGSSRTMSNLPDIVKAITLNNKIDESRDFARMVQTSMNERLRKVNRTLKNLGVKQAPFVVLIGATMPGILAEVSFLTNRTEGSLLRTPNYRQQLAEALFAGVMKYAQSLKTTRTLRTQN